MDIQNSELLKYTKKIATKVSLYNNIVTLTKESSKYNPFYLPKATTVIWVEKQ